MTNRILPEAERDLELQVPPTVNPEGVLQHDVRSTDTIMDTAPVAYLLRLTIAEAQTGLDSRNA
jgi:hypothetical protein